MKKQLQVNKVIHLLVLFILLLSLTGCWDRNEIDKRAYVIAIGLDKAKNESDIKITYLISNPEFGSQIQGGSTEEPAQETITFETNDLVTARTTANAVVAKEITYDMLKVILVSEELAKDENFIRWMYDATKDIEIRRNISFVVTKEAPSKFIEKNKPKLETRPHKYFELMLQRGAEAGMSPESELYNYFRITEADAGLYLAAYATSEKTSGGSREAEDEDDLFAGQFHPEGKTNNTQFFGSAIFKEGKMIGKLTGEDTRLTIIMNDILNATDILTTFPDPFNKKYRLGARIVKKRNNEVNVNLEKTPGTIDVTIPLKIKILTDHSMVNYATSKEKRDVLKKYLEERLTEKFEELVKKTQEEYKAEPFAWSLYVRKQFLTIPEYKDFDWMKSYPDMKVSIKVNIQFGEFGRQGELPNLEKMRD